MSNWFKRLFGMNDTPESNKAVGHRQHISEDKKTLDTQSTLYRKLSLIPIAKWKYNQSGGHGGLTSSFSRSSITTTTEGGSQVQIERVSKSWSVYRDPDISWEMDHGSNQTYTVNIDGETLFSENYSDQNLPAGSIGTLYKAITDVILAPERAKLQAKLNELDRQAKLRQQKVIDAEARLKDKLDSL